jgi:hypothetical protein
MYINYTIIATMVLSCAERQRRKGGAKRPTGDLRDALHDVGISKDKGYPHASRVFSIHATTTLMRMALSYRDISVVDGSNALARGERGNRFTIVVVGKCHLNRYRHLFGHQLVHFLVVNHPRDEDPAIQQVLMRIKSGTRVYLVTGDTKQDPIMDGALHLGQRGGKVVVFTRHPNTSAKEQRQMYHHSLQQDVAIAQKGGSLAVYGVCEETPRGAPSPRE